MEEVKPRPQNAELRSIEGQYKRDVAIVTARPKIVSAAFVAWGMLDVFLLAFFFLTVVLYLVSGSFADSRLEASLGNNLSSAKQVSIARAPSDLVVGNTSVLQHDAALDAFTTISNPNADWYATFLLKPSTADSTESELAFINPGEERTFAMFHLAGFSTRDRLIISDITWQRIDRHLIASPSDWLAARSNISIDDVKYARDITVGTSPISHVSFTVNNRTAFSYWQPVFIVRVLRGSTTIAINKVTIPELVSGQTQSVDVRFFGNLPDTATATIEPAIFYFDPNSYSNTPGGESSVDVRQTL